MTEKTQKTHEEHPYIRMSDRIFPSPFVLNDILLENRRKTPIEDNDTQGNMISTRSLPEYRATGVANQNRVVFERQKPPKETLGRRIFRRGR